MNQVNYKISTTTLSLLFSAGVYLFFSIYYPAHLHYQEQYQLFLFDASYWYERITIPGGFAEYVGEFLTQFYYHAWLGAAVITLLLWLLQQLVWCVAKIGKACKSYYPLSFLPSIAAWSFLCDENAMLAGLIALILTLLATWAFHQIERFSLRLVCGTLLTPALYWLLGPASFLFVIYISLKEVSYTPNSLDKKKKLVLVALLVLAATIIPLVTWPLLAYPLVNLLTGIGYYRFPAVLPYSLIILFAATLATPLLMNWLPTQKETGKRNFVLQAAIVLLTTYFAVSTAMNSAKEEAMCYDYLVRTRKWVEIIEMAKKNVPTSPFNVSCLNLALGKTGQLGERMFEFYQNGAEGLLPTFQRDFTSPLPTSEAFYHLGMINTAQRFTFEAMEAIPNFRKSARCYKRLAETNIINGEYEAARKYIDALAKTLFYRNWAQKAATYLYEETKIAKHPEWGWMRKIRYSEDFLFSHTEIDRMLGRLVQHNIENRLAFEYMLAYVLLQKDLQKFLQYYPLGKEMNYAAIPKSYQEVLVYVWTQQHGSLKGIPWSITAITKARVHEFAQIYMKQKESEALLKQKFGNTYWYYLLFRK